MKRSGRPEPCDSSKVRPVPAIDSLRTNHLLLVTGTITELLLHLVPITDPNDPLNWSTIRKAINFGLVGFFVLWTFVHLQIGSTSWGPLMVELHFTIEDLNNEVAVSCAVGCIFFMPFVHKYGRHPLYMTSLTLQLGSVVWQAETKTIGDWMGSKLVAGLGGVRDSDVRTACETQTVFLHHHLGYQRGPCPDHHC
jgi:hypothetical protein